MKTQSLTNQETIDIVNAFRAGIARTAHHVRLTGLVLSAIRAELGKLNGDPESWVVTYGQVGESITIWGPKGYETRFTVYGRNGHTDRTWAEGLLEGAKICDVTDYVEREYAECSPEVFQRLTLLQEEAARLLTRLEIVRKHASETIEALPIPATAVSSGVRSGAHFWSRPSKPTAERFPALFPKS